MAASEKLIQEFYGIIPKKTFALVWHVQCDNIIFPKTFSRGSSK